MTILFSFKLLIVIAFIVISVTVIGGINRLIFIQRTDRR